MVGSRSTSAREPGQVRKEAALSGYRWAVRGRPAGVFERDQSPEADFDIGCTVHFFPMPPFSAFDKRGYRTVDARSGYGAWAATYEDTVQDAMDLDLLD